jgi:hypothetical protein
MTTQELAGAYERLAQILRTQPEGPLYPQKPSITDGEMLFGAAMLWDYLRSLFTCAGKDVFTREEVLMVLEQVASDGEIFLPGAIRQIADAEDDE